MHVHTCMYILLVAAVAHPAGGNDRALAWIVGKCSGKYYCMGKSNIVN